MKRSCERSSDSASPGDADAPTEDGAGPPEGEEMRGIGAEDARDEVDATTGCAEMPTHNVSAPVDDGGGRGAGWFE